MNNLKLIFEYSLLLNIDYNTYLSFIKYIKCTSKSIIQK